MYSILKRIFDFIASLIALLVLSPILLIIALWISIDSKGGPFYKQIRVGLNGVEFKLYKFRSMRVNADKQGQITIGNDNRVTSVGRFIRKYKIDEIPQLFNILKGDMSVVGPRPEVPKYVALYSTEQREVLRVKPGLTDYASLEYIDEQKILGQSNDPNNTYIKEIMPAKLALNRKYIEERSVLTDCKLIINTLLRILN
ncbi:sugar transferase [Crocinitomix algicola]|uniref:sugar transferase n=1 Tax=Crocinitomix algicola TaxID=1740263 RepID=UPI000872FCCD|nr:sugar transferase [Crocinitomix algicola]